jgi:hypothetical protein
MANRGQSTVNSFNPVFRANASPHDDRSDSYACPMCGGHGLVRIRRRFIDRILSVFIRLRRFRCTHSECQWVGNLRERKNENKSIPN